MSELIREELIRVAHRFYPTGFPVEQDDYSQPLLAHQRSPEHERWRAAWKQALEWEPWARLLTALEATVSPEDVRDATQPWHSACRRCCIYVRQARPDGSRVVIRVAAAVSILAPLYVTYVTTRTSRPGARASSPQLTFEPPSEVAPQVRMLTSLLGQELGFRLFPLEWGSITLPGLRVGYLNSREPPTLLEALFSDDLANLP